MIMEKEKKYIVEKVVHNGRKDELGKPVTQEKYHGLIGYEVKCNDLNDIVLFEPLYMKVINSPRYVWWYTSDVMNSVHIKKDNKYVVETLNSIYYFRKVK